MSLITDMKYIQLLGSQLERFRKTGKSTWNFRCPICGDSQKNKYKCRGYMFSAKDCLIYKCHNCSASMAFSKFLSQISPLIHNDYIIEKFNHIPKRDKDETYPVRIIKNNILKNSTAMNKVDRDSVAFKFLRDRQIPMRFYSSLYYVDNLRKFVSYHSEDIEKYPECSGVLIPFYNLNNILVGYQCRTLVGCGRRYYSVKLYDDEELIYGLNKIIAEKEVYVVEGPFDSMFVPNCIAIGGASNKLNLNPPTTTIIFDNEPRNNDIVRFMNKYIRKGYGVCVWPGDLLEKDINDMVLSGLTKEDVFGIIQKNSYRGLMAKLQLESWKKL